MSKLSTDCSSSDSFRTSRATLPTAIRQGFSLVIGAAVLTLAACSSDSDSGTGTGTSITTSVSALQGSWQAACDAVRDDLSVRSSLLFDGSAVERSDIFYVGNNSCSSGTIFNLVADATFSLPGGTTATDQGDAQHIDIDINNVTATSTQTLDALLALQGISFDQLLQNELGIAQPGNITPESVGFISPLFTLTLIEGDTLFFGDSDSNQGTEAETRLTTLDDDPAVTYERLP